MGVMFSNSTPWETLMLFQSRDVLSDVYKRRHGGELNKAKADEIIAHIVQAKQYFEALRGIGGAVRPTILYYGTLALARAVTLLIMTAFRRRRRAGEGVAPGLLALCVRFF